MAELLSVDWFVLLVPLALLPIIALFVFVGCELSHPARGVPGEIALRADPATFDVTAMEVLGFFVRPTMGPTLREDAVVTQQALTLSPSPPAAGVFRGSYERILRTGPEPSIVIYSLRPSSLPVGSGSFVVHPRIRDGLTDRRSLPGAHFTFTVQPATRGLVAHRLRVVRSDMGATVVEPVPAGQPFGRPSGAVTIELAFDRARADVTDATFTITVGGASTVASHNVTLSPTTITVTALGRPTAIRAGRRYDGVHTRSFPGTRETYQLVVGGSLPGDYRVGCAVTVRTATGPVTVQSSRSAVFNVTTDTTVAGAGFDVIVAGGAPTIVTR